MATVTHSETQNHVRAHNGGPNTISESVTEVGRSVRKLAEETAHQAKEIGATAYDQLARTGKDQSERIEAQVRDRPMTSVLFAAGIGFLLGALFRR